MTREIRALWKKLGPHAPAGSKLAIDNQKGFELYYRSVAKQIRETKPDRHSRDYELFALMCLPCAYGWPMSRPFNKGSKYTGVVPVHVESEFEVTMDTWPRDKTAAVTLLVDGVKVPKAVTPNKPFRLQLQAGVRALTLLTEDDVRIHFEKLRLKQVPAK